MKIISIAVIHFEPFVSSISLQRNVVSPSNFKVSGFKKLSSPREGIPLLLFTFVFNMPRRFLFSEIKFIMPGASIPILFPIVFPVPPRFLFFHCNHLGTCRDSSFGFNLKFYLSTPLARGGGPG